MTNRFSKELTLYKDGVNIVIGVDEVGRGPLAGPVVAAAVCFTADDDYQNFETQDWWHDIVDSKLLSEKKREYLYDLIMTHSHSAVGEASVQEIETINILQGSLLAMRRAVEQLFSKIKISSPENSVLLIDGRNTIPNFNSKQEAIVKGDSSIHSIAASSIIAKVYRDRLMKQLDVDYPEYGLAQHKGYGTKLHIEAIRNHGLSPVHRPSFCNNFI